MVRSMHEWHARAAYSANRLSARRPLFYVFIVLVLFLGPWLRRLPSHVYGHGVLLVPWLRLCPAMAMAMASLGPQASPLPSHVYIILYYIISSMVAQAMILLAQGPEPAAVSFLFYSKHMQIYRFLYVRVHMYLFIYIVVHTVPIYIEAERDDEKEVAVAAAETMEAIYK